MTETGTITLGGRRFEIRPLTFRQLRDIEDALGRAFKAGAQTRIDFDAAVDIVAAAISRTDPTVNRETILDLEGTKDDIVTATRAVLRASGHIERAEPSPGEQQAGD